jgi:hypothetical protein
LVDWGHLRVRRRGILCHRLIRRSKVHRSEHYKQCEAFDLDCANLLFPHRHNFSFSRNGLLPVTAFFV